MIFDLDTTVLSSFNPVSPGSFYNNPAVAQGQLAGPFDPIIHHLEREHLVVVEVLRKLGKMTIGSNAGALRQAMSVLESPFAKHVRESGSVETGQWYIQYFHEEMVGVQKARQFRKMVDVSCREIVQIGRQLWVDPRVAAQRAEQKEFKAGVSRVIDMLQMRKRMEATCGSAGLTLNLPATRKTVKELEKEVSDTIGGSKSSKKTKKKKGKKGKKSSPGKAIPSPSGMIQTNYPPTRPRGESIVNKKKKMKRLERERRAKEKIEKEAAEKEVSEVVGEAEATVDVEDVSCTAAVGRGGEERAELQELSVAEEGEEQLQEQREQEGQEQEGQEQEGQEQEGQEQERADSRASCTSSEQQDDDDDGDDDDDDDDGDDDDDDDDGDDDDENDGDENDGDEEDDDDDDDEYDERLSPDNVEITECELDLETCSLEEYLDCIPQYREIFDQMTNMLPEAFSNHMRDQFAELPHGCRGLFMQQVAEILKETETTGGATAEEEKEAVEEDSSIPVHKI
jgi:segregation and condensation protein B